MTRTTKTAAAAPAPGNSPNERRAEAARRNHQQRKQAEAAAAADGCNVEQVKTAERNLSPTTRRHRLPNVTAGGPVRIAHVDPAKLATMTPEELTAALQAATVTKTASIRAARPRVTITAETAAMFQRLSWSVPFADTDRTYQPKHRERFNNSKGAAAYTVAIAALQVGPITLTDLARLWIASGNPAKNPGQIAEQLATRAQRPIHQTGDKLQLITA